MTGPDLGRKASEIDDPVVLYTRIGYRTWLIFRDGESAKSRMYEGFNRTDLRRLSELARQAGQ